MDPRSLALVLRGALSPVPEERRAAEEALTEFQCTPQHLVTLLQIIVDDTCDMAVRHVGSIHLKNFVAKNWLPFKPGEPQKISEGDKSIVRTNILRVVVEVPGLLRAQVIECIRTIINVDYPEQWPGLLHWIKCNLHSQDQHVLGALYVLLVLIRKYHFKFNEERLPLSVIVEDIFLHLLTVFNKTIRIANPSTEVADLIKNICKIFWSSVYVEIPKQLCDPNIFNSWMVLFLTILGRTIHMEGQPSDPDDKKLQGWWKVKKWTIIIFTTLLKRFDDLKPQTPDMRIIAQMFYKKYAAKILECHLKYLNVLRSGGYLPDRVIVLVFQYLQSCILNNSIYRLLHPRLDIIIFEIIFPLMCFNDNDGKLWKEDPHEYVRKRYVFADSLQDLYSPRSAAVDLLLVLLTKCEKCCFQKFIHFIGETFRRYNEAPIDAKPYSLKCGALHAIGVLSSILKQMEPYKSQLECMLLTHVIPDFMSSVAHLRAKAAWVAGLYADIEFSEQNYFQMAMNCAISGLCDPELPVQVDSVFALSCFMEACKDLNEIRRILPRLLNDMFKLMGEVDNDDVVCTLEILVVKFGEEMAPYAIGLCENLAAAFWKRMNISEANVEAEDSIPVAAVGCLHAISIVLESVNKLSHLYVQIEPILLPIMQRMLTPEGEEVFEEVIEIVTYMTYFSPTISMAMWSLWPLIMDALQDWAVDFFENILVPLNNYISRDTAHFLACKEPDYQQSLWVTLSSIITDKNLNDDNIEPAPKLIAAVLQNCKGHVDHWIQPYLIVTIDRLHRTEKPYLKCLLVQVIANALYYNASLTLDTLHKLGVTTEIFNFWFELLQVDKSGRRANFRRAHDKKVCCLGLTSLLGLLAEKLPQDAFKSVFIAILALLVSYKNQATDDEDDRVDELDQEMRIDVEDGNRKENGENDESDDDYCDDEDLQSPIDEVDPFIFFVETVQVIQASDPARFHNFMGSLDLHNRTLAVCIDQHAEERRNRDGKGDSQEQPQSGRGLIQLWRRW
ncbi:importin beta-like SAD2 isoform X2 [Ananas comosus]|uniref:Importin beta-like SAD2 isoform X2 n=1 Tax=Ananas comosus TaxID=4615 RepID=A0A6P5GUS6_ANACO|nr:importin beta-like SAD2 isoform X2 [Ananas comosus]